MASQATNTFLLATIASLVGVTFSSQAGISALPVLDSAKKHGTSDAKPKLISALSLGVPLGTLAIALVLGLDAIFSFMGTSIGPTNPPKLVPVSSGVVLGLEGGFYEEALLRLGLLTFVAWLLKGWEWKLWGAIVISAVLFGVGHLPALYQVAQVVTPMLIIRTILLNVVGGIVFGFCYVKRGYASAVSAHFTADFVKHGILQALIP